jgi:hypothetical protein
MNRHNFHSEDIAPPYHLAFEADGDYWHGNEKQKAKDRRRDGFLKSKFGLLTARLSESELKEMRRVEQ